MQRTDFVHFYELPVRWGDLDALGHVNNVQLIGYLECGRVAYCDEVLGLQFTPALKQGWILADIQCTFHQQLQFPCSIEVATRISRLGTSSAELVAAIFKRGSDGLILSSHAVAVWFNYEKQAGTPIPETVRSSIKRFEKTAPDESVSSHK